MSKMKKGSQVPRILDQETLRLGFLAGARRVIANREELDRINVFPVPDRDTGSNLAATMSAVVRRLARPHPSVSSVGSSIAAAALSGAQGNSGVIVAQFFQGLCESFSGAVHVSVDRFVGGIRHAAVSARQALAQPREGTILTVITDVADHLADRARHLQDFKTLIEEGVRVARESLARTPEKLEVLRRAGVVDAGALGFVRFLEGIRDYLVEGRTDALPPELEAVTDPVPQEAPSLNSFDRVDFRYCTEAVVRGANIDRPTVLSALTQLGNSAIVAGGDEEIHTHVHTNVPAYVLETLGGFGTIEQTKVEDMLAMIISDVPVVRDGVALVTDSVRDLPIRWFTEQNVHVVPLRIAFGQERFLDRVDITPRQFYGRLQQDPVFPRTSQPSPADFHALYRHLSRYYEGILSIHVSAEVSGTFQSAQQVAREVWADSGIPISVVDSRSASAAEGLVVWASARALDAGCPLEACASIARRTAERTSVYVFVPTIDNFVRGGRLSPMRGRISNLFHLRPILTVVDGRVTMATKVLGIHNAKRKTVQLAVRDAEAMKRPAFCLSHTAAPELAVEVGSRLNDRFPSAVCFRSDAAPALGSHAGPGGLAIAVTDAALVDTMIEREGRTT